MPIIIERTRKPFKAEKKFRLFLRQYQKIITGFVTGVIIIAVICTIITIIGGEETNLDNVEPYVSYLGNLMTGNSVALSSEERDGIESVTIGNIEGTVSYTKSREFAGNYLTIAEVLEWVSNDTGYSSRAYKKIRKAVTDYYSVDVSEGFGDDKIMLCSNSYYTIRCSLEDEGVIKIRWIYNTSCFNPKSLGGYVAVYSLQDALKNPNSLTVNSVQCTTEELFGYEEDYGYKIDYSAQNGFGGYSRNTYYVLIDHTDFSVIKLNSAEKALLSISDFKNISVNINTPSALKPTYVETDAKLINPAISYSSLKQVMDEKMMRNVSYVGKKYREIDAVSKEGGSYYVYWLDEARFLDEDCISKISFNADGVSELDSTSKNLEISCSKSVQDVLNELTEKMDSEPYDVYQDSNSETKRFYMLIPDTDLVFYVSENISGKGSTISVEYADL